MNKKTIFLASSGTSPAVLTETIWALARENPPVIPDKIIVLTTTVGKYAIEEKLLDPGIWRQLRRTILGPAADGKDSRLDLHSDSVQAVRRCGADAPLAELAEPADHTAFADAVMHELWAWTSRPDTRVVASLAGGFKTMSALMLSTMQLLANPGDRLTHVLISGGYDQTSEFFFPEQENQQLTTRDGAKLRAAEAAEHIRLIDIPLIPLRAWFRDFLHHEPQSYDVLISHSIEAVRKRTGELILELSVPEANPLWLKLNDAKHELTPGLYAWLSFFVKMKKGGKNFSRTVDMWDELQEYVGELYSRNDKFHVLAEGTFSTENLLDEDRINEIFRKRLSDLKTFLKKLGPDGRIIADALPAKGSYQFNFPPENLIFPE